MNFPPFQVLPVARPHLLAGTALCALLLTGLARPAAAQDATTQMNQIEQQIRALQSELQSMKRAIADRDAQIRAARADAAKAQAQSQAAQSQAAQAQAAQAQAAQTQAAQPAVNLAPPQAVAQTAVPTGTVSTGTVGFGKFQLGGVTVTLGGFIEAAGIFRTRNEVADIGSNFNTGIPYPNSVLNHENELRFSARQSRVSLLVQADPDPVTKLAAYFETDFLGAAPTANSAESNSYNLRIRNIYATYERSDWGFHALGGQSWSLITLGKIGITPRQENVPLTIDAQYVPGFTWTRNPQFRIAEDFADHKFWLAASVESPQGNFYVGPNGTGVPTGQTVNVSNAGGSLYAPTNNYSDDIAPDVIIKAAADPGWGHYEAYGLARFLHDRVSTVGAGSNHTTLAGGGGVGVILPVVPKMIDFQLSGLAGYGIGRYGSTQLPDAIVGSNGAPVPLPEFEALAGLIAHPTPAIDLYGYVGTEQAAHKYFTVAGKGYGYGSPLYSNAGCETELSTAACTANTSGVVQGTVGAWWRFLQGNYGTAQMGLQYSYTHRSIFGGTTTGGTNGQPSVDENVFLVSFRYYPFQ